jgi:hypothetical protein
MRLLRWLGVGCVAAAGLVLAFAAGVLVTKPGEPAVTEQAKQPAPPTKRVTPNTEKLPESLPPSVKPAPPVRPANDVPKGEPLPVVPLPVPEVKVVPLVLPDLPASSLPRAGEPVAPITPVQGVTGVVPVPDSPAKQSPVQYVNKPELEFEYAVGKKGKSGVREVRLLVRDATLAGKPDAPQLPQIPLADPNAKPRPNGHWTEAASAVADANSPKLRYTMPGEGKYDFRLKVTANNGNHAEPRDADPADLTVVLDGTPPAIHRFQATVDAERNLVTFSLDVADANRGDTKLDLIEYRTAPDGKWQVAKLNDPNWPIPDDAPAEVAFRLTVTDEAGNVATKVIEKVNLDTTTPEGKLTKVRAVEPLKKEELKPEERRVPRIEEKK